jgi:hypothetical protein
MGNKKTLGVYTFVHNITKYDYPFEESLNSALPIADEIVILECSSEDDTIERIRKWISEAVRKSVINITLITGEPWATHHTHLSMLGNKAMDYLTTDWHWQLQADEVIHEDSYDEIRSLIQYIPSNLSAITTRYTHMLANYSTEFDFCYQSAIRIARRGSPWRLVGDACQLGDGKGNEVYNASIKVFHYGKVHNGGTGYQKEVDFQDLFKDLGFPDPRMKEMLDKLGKPYCDYIYLFQQDIADGKVRKFTGEHPKVMAERIKAFKGAGWEQFESLIDPEIKV